MPHMPRRFRSVRPDAEPRQLAPTDSVPPDLLDVTGDLPVSADPPTDKPPVARNPVTRRLSGRAPGLDSLSMKSFSVDPDEVQRGLFE